ncbi:MAG: MBL fold metallo-hydrolase [Deltaproteobacteria bacterium]|jgi:phosphoribosyl 1,2-cyclic phosphodiesterase|nr:MBL fold metallo-hydrolase [Deltaproteobacteria bacterium]
MLIRFWGVRGSLPSPTNSKRYRDRLAEILSLAVERGLTLPEIPEFIQALPPRLAGLVGGNTPCLEISSRDATLIFDAGSGLKNLGDFLSPAPDLDVLEERSAPEAKPRLLDLNLFFTHTHWDHIQGFPFFAPIYDENVSLTIYSSDSENVEKSLRVQQSTPKLFPIHFDDLAAKIQFRPFPKEGLTLPPFQIDSLSIPHPGGSTAYRVKAFGRSVVFATDYELQWDSPDSARKKERLKSFIQRADAFISDSQYTYLESHSKEGWGHSNVLNVVEMAQLAGVKNLYLFHHDPSYGDAKLHDMLEKATSYVRLLFPKSSMRVFLATEGQEIEFPET